MTRPESRKDLDRHHFPVFGILDCGSAAKDSLAVNTNYKVRAIAILVKVASEFRI